MLPVVVVAKWIVRAFCGLYVAHTFESQYSNVMSKSTVTVIVDVLQNLKNLTNPGVTGLKDNFCLTWLSSNHASSDRCIKYCVL